MCNYDELIKDYRTSDDSIWAYPPEDFDNELPPVGFKIHVSAIIANASEIFIRVEKILKECSVSYKVISSLKNLAGLNSGEFGYSQIGKFITIYPNGEMMFTKVLELLYYATLGFQSVAIPSDFRYKNSCIVFYRFGELYAPESQESSNDRRIREIPEGIVVPVSDYYIKRYEKMPDNYVPLTCIRARGKSRVFHGADILRKTSVIIKEGLMLGEIDLNGYDGANSIIQEKEILYTLSDIKAFPSLIDYFYVGSSFVIIEEYKEGKTIKQLLENEDYKQIALYKEKILEQLLELLIILQQREIHIGDISPDNIIVDKNGQIFLIDVEYYRFYYQEDKDIPGTAGFWCEEYSGDRAVIYAFISLWYYLSFPSKYRVLLSEKENLHKSNLKEYQRICDNASEIMEKEDYKSALNILKNCVKGGNCNGTVTDRTYNISV